MSIKIYNGYRRKVENLDDLQNFLNDFKEKAKRLHQKAYTAAFIDCVVGIVDARTAEVEDPNDDKSNVPYWIAHKTIQDEYTKTKLPIASRAMLYDFECSLSIFLEGEYAYFLIFAENQKFHKLFSRQKSVHEFNFWNNTDKPNHISDKRWEERSEIWDRVLGPSGVPADRSMTLEVVGNYASPSTLMMAKIIKNQPSFEDRVKRMANRTVFKHRKPKNNLKDSMSNLLAWLRSDEYKELNKLEQVELAKKLKRTLEKEDIY